MHDDLVPAEARQRGGDERHELPVALTATIYNVDIDLADADRAVYESLALHVARHPSESEEYLVTRILAHALEFHEGIVFSPGLSDPGEPAISVRDLTGAIQSWIDIGIPDAARLHKASKAAPRVVVYTHKDPAQLVGRLSDGRIHRAEALERTHHRPAPDRRARSAARAPSFIRVVEERRRPLPLDRRGHTDRERRAAPDRVSDGANRSSGRGRSSTHALTSAVRKPDAERTSCGYSALGAIELPRRRRGKKSEEVYEETECGIHEADDAQFGARRGRRHETVAADRSDQEVVGDIKKNKLQDQKNKRMIKADENLKVVFWRKSHGEHV